MASPQVPCLETARQILQKKKFERSQEEIHQLALFLSSDKGFLHHLRIDLVERIAKWAGYTRMSPGMVVVKEGEPGDVMYIVLKGYCKVFKYGKQLNQKQVDDENERKQKTGFGEYGSHVGWVSEKEMFGEMCLVTAHNLRTASVVSGEHGVELITLERSTFNHLNERARHDVQASEVLQALLTACSRRILQISPHLRTEDDVEALAAMTRSLKAFASFPADICLKLARTMVHIYLPPGTVLFEEDDPGDSMYIIIAGRLSVRSRPLVEPPKKEEDVMSTRMTNAILKSESQKHGNESGDTEPQRSTSMLQESMSSTPDNASHAQEKSSGEDENQNSKTNNSQYWISKYFQQARTTIQAQDPSSGCGNSVSPLASIYAAKWRKTILDRKAQEEEEEEDKPEQLTGMAALLGPAAARMWRQRTFGNKHRRASNGSNSTQPTTIANDTITEASGEQPSNMGSYRSSDVGASLTSDQPSSRRRTDESDSTLPGASSVLTVTKTEDQERSDHLEDKGEDLIHAGFVYDPNKKILSEIGQQCPSDVSKFLLAEVCDRTDLSNTLRDVAKQIHFSGPPRRLTRKDSKKLTKLINRKLIGGPSKKGFGQSRQVDHAVLLSEHKDDETDRQTDIGTSDWKSSFEFSETASIGTFETHSELEEDIINDELGNDGVGGDERQRSGRRMSHGGELLDCEVGSEVEEEMKINPATKYGPVVRSLEPGESFGELALLQRHAKRTATVLSPEAEASEGEATQQHNGKVPQGGVHLIRITRFQYDIAARSMQAHELENLLSFIKKMPPFKKLPRDKLTSLAIFCQPICVSKGDILAAEGDPMDKMFMIQEGEVTLCTHSSRGLRRTISNPVGGFSHRPPLGNPLKKSASMGHSNRHLLRQLSASASSFSDENKNKDGAGGVEGDQSSATKSTVIKQLGDMAPLMVLGKGEILGEAVLGYEDVQGSQFIEPEELDESQPKSRHTATILATRKTRLVALSASDLVRFGRKVQQELRSFASKRREFCRQRKKAVENTNQDLEEIYASAKKQSTTGRTSLDVHGSARSSPSEKENKASGRSSKSDATVPHQAPIKATSRTDAVKKAGIAWLMEDVQNLTYATCSPNHKAKRTARLASYSSEWDTGSENLSQTLRQNSAGSSRHPGIPPLRPYSREQSMNAQRNTPRTGRIHNESQPSDSTDGFLDEFSRLERAFRQRLAIKERSMSYNLGLRSAIKGQMYGSYQMADSEYGEGMNQKPPQLRLDTQQDLDDQPPASPHNFPAFQS